ncbi:DUF1345 domain-containing protein [Leifsonia sp. L25]|uniref:DUF1345 domain-containing protein n=1 Tax=Leifsonia TaxID=110932 RepID=UPI003D6771A2
MTSPDNAPHRGWVRAGFAANLLVQGCLTIVGVWVVLSPGLESSISLLTTWCLIATVYLIGVWVVLAVNSRRARPAPAAGSLLYTDWTARSVVAASTLFASLTGIVSAIQVRVVHDDALLDLFADVVGTCAMLLSWGLLHWGYAQLYHRRSQHSPEPVIAFPGTGSPRLSDFVYFAFTIGTSFAASDTEILSPRLRWAVAKHSILSFFYNGAIIVVALNVLTH